MAFIPALQKLLKDVSGNEAAAASKEYFSHIERCWARITTRMMGWLEDAEVVHDVSCLYTFDFGR